MRGASCSGRGSCCYQGTYVQFLYTIYYYIITGIQARPYYHPATYCLAKLHLSLQCNQGRAFRRRIVLPFLVSRRQYCVFSHIHKVFTHLFHDRF